MPSEQTNFFWKRLQVALFILTMAASVMWLSLWDHYVQTRPREPQSASGRVIPLFSHGVVVYLTQEERGKLTLIYRVGCTVAVSGVLVYLFKRPFGR